MGTACMGKRCRVCMGTACMGKRCPACMGTAYMQVGAEVGVGICEDIRGRGTNWWLFGRTMLGWLLAFSFAGLCSAALFSFCE